MRSTSIDFIKNSGKISIVKSLSAVDYYTGKNMVQGLKRVFICNDKGNGEKSYLQSNQGRRWNRIQIMWR